MPSAAMSNYATKLVNGNVSLSITLTSLCALLSFITVPLYLNLFGKYIYEDFFELNLIIFSIKTFLFITVPVFLGIYCRKKFRAVFEKNFFTRSSSIWNIFNYRIYCNIHGKK